jgi:hypothetical protein
VIYKFKKPWDDGTTAMKLTPMELMERLVALVPRPRVHLTRYHGVLGPHYKHRKQIVPKPPELKVTGQEQDIIDPKQLELKKKNIPWARLLARVFNIDVETCSKCGGKMKIIAAIEDPKVIRKILEHMGLDTKPPRLMPARGPPKVQHHFEDDFSLPKTHPNYTILPRSRKTWLLGLINSCFKIPILLQHTFKACKSLAKYNTLGMCFILIRTDFTARVEWVSAVSLPKRCRVKR